MAEYNYGRTWADRTRSYGRTAKRPIVGTLLRQSDKAFLISTGTREAWVPKRLVSHDEASGIFTMPQWLANEKRLD